MTRTYLFASIAACALLVGASCSSKPSPNPASPTVDLSELRADAAADGSTLKATAPAAQSPANGTKPSEPQLQLVAGNASLLFVSGLPLTYRYEIQNTSGSTVYAFSGVPAGPGGTTVHTPSGATLTADQTYRWRARAEYQGLVGPWSELAAFIAPASEGYVSGSELYDPLINGKTIGEIHGPVTFIPGVGVKLETQLSYISYQLPQTLTEGEFSILVTNLHENTEGGKTKLFGMAQGYDDIVVNDRRMTVEKRGDPPGIVAWRLITHHDQIDTEGAEREFVPFDPSDSYLWEATWRNNFFNVLIREGGANGPIIYSKGKGFHGAAYDPDPHVIYIGAPVGRSGPDGASVDGVIVRHVWVSSRPRPSFAN